MTKIAKLVGMALGSTDIGEAVAALRSARRLQPSGKLPNPEYADAAEAVSSMSAKDLTDAALSAHFREFQKQREIDRLEAAERIRTDARFCAKVSWTKTDDIILARNPDHKVTREDMLERGARLIRNQRDKAAKAEKRRAATD